MVSLANAKIEVNRVNYFIWPKHCFAFVQSNTNWHAHPAIQLYYAFDKQIAIELETGVVIEGRLIAIPSHITRRVRQSTPILQFTFHPFDIGNQKIASLDSVQSLDVSNHFHRVIEGFSFQTLDVEQVVQVKRQCEHTIMSIAKQEPMDERVGKAFDYLSTHYQSKIDIQQIANNLAISDSRLQHLFKDQIGMTMSRYQQWLRLRMSFQLIAQGSKVVDAAMESGFTDQAHFSNLFKRFFGYAPNDLLKRYGNANIHIMQMMVD